ENVLAGLMFSRIPRGEHRARAASLLERLGIERVDAMPETLSVGQQQRVAVARAVAARPTLVLADEPTASLDPENADGALELIKDACRDAGSALLCVSHDPTASSHFDRVEDLADLAGLTPAESV
ncbi:MAG: ATP-binding cassette domain-containing protein, partial [Planctomycetota bacterium]